MLIFIIENSIMAKYTNITEQTKQKLLDKLFYFLARGVRPVVVKTLIKKDPKFANSWNKLEKAKKEVDDIFAKNAKLFGR